VHSRHTYRYKTSIIWTAAFKSSVYFKQVKQLVCLFVFVETRRQQTEAPIPGYRGYIPRVRTTELGLGTRYHEMTKNGLDYFYTARHDREKKYGPLPDTFGAQRHQPTRIKRLAVAEAAAVFYPSV